MARGSKRVDAIKTPKGKTVDSPKEKKTPKKNKLSFSEKREWEDLPIQITALEDRREELNQIFESNKQDPDQLVKASEEIERIITELDQKEMRWLELSEFESE